MGRGEVYTWASLGNVRDTDHLGDPDVNWRIILRWNFRRWDGRMDWIELAQDRDGWRTLEEGVMKFHV